MLTAAFARHLDSLGLGKYDRAGTDVFLETLPQKPEDACAVFAQPGRRVGTFRRPGLQVIVRADGKGNAGRAREGFERAQAILDAFDGTAHVTWAEGTPDEVRVAWCEAQAVAPVNLGDDDNGRPKWSIRFDVELAGERVAS